LTAQIPNSVILKEEKFSITGFTNEGLINPKDFGINPIMSSTACWRGFVTKYKIDKESNFVLDELKVKTNHDDEEIEINGISPKAPTNKLSRRAFNRVYEQINLRVNFSGFILIGANFIQELYKHMGFHKSWKFERVYEIEIDKGKVKSITDLSEKMLEIRNVFKEQKTDKSQPTKDEISKWVESSFNQKYKKEKK
jgi:hypothetical protein